MKRGPCLRHTGPVLLGLMLLAASVVHAQHPLRLRLSAELSQLPGLTPTPTRSETPWSQATQRWQPGQPFCETQQPPPWSQLSLGDALAHTLCRSPSMRRALAEAAAQAAAVDISEQARRPTWSANAEYSAARNFNSFGSSGRTASASLGLSWALLDFGQRSANLQAARQSLASALAEQDNAVLDAVRETVRQYGEAVVADASLRAAEEAEASAEQTAAAAQARYQAQVGNQIDRLQAQTALAQATLERVRAQSSWENARGQLALALGADIEQPLRLAAWEEWALPDEDVPALTQLRDEARQQHPRLRSGLAQIDALRAQLDAVVAESRGNVNLSASAGSSRNWGAAGTGTIPTANASLVATIPVFNGRETEARKRQLVSQIDAREAELEAVRRSVDSQLWQAYQSMSTSRQSLLAAARLLTSASATLQVAQGRYKAGVGSMQDLLAAQSSLADARRQRVSALVEQLTARTQLSLATGRLGPRRH